MSVPPRRRRVELRVWTDDACHEVICEDDAEVTVTVDAELTMLAGPNRVEIVGIRRIVRHSLPYLTRDQRRIRALEAEVARLRAEGGP